MAKHYYIPHIKIEDVVTELRQLETELGEEVKAAYSEIREKQIEDG